MAALVGALMGGSAGYVAGTILIASDSSTASTSNLPEIIARARQWIVMIDVQATTTWPRGEAFTEQSAGTGVIIRSDGMIATNAHVVAGAQVVVVTLADGSKRPATIVGSDLPNDLAVIHIDGTDLAAADIGDSGAVRVGDIVIAIGNALSLEGDPTATLGMVSAMERTISTSTVGRLEHLLQVDAAINAGTSGGPLVNTAGQVIGINTATSTSAQSIGFAIPMRTASPILNELMRLRATPE